MNRVLRFLYSFAAVAVTAFISSYFVESGMPVFYHTLVLPPLTPPDALFAPVWSVLYVLMIWSFYRILNASEIERVQEATALFLGQLVLHALWCWLFFYSEKFSHAFICLLLLIWTVFIMIRQFKRMDPPSAYMQYPYLIWLIFAAYLNAGVIWLNGDF